ncbi:MAG TPA: DUF2017 domain-containing protein [Actinomycetes bacterium]|nr:DUF2017 domain-containing protein [Actinomycetes bacterium]
MNGFSRKRRGGVTLQLDAVETVLLRHLLDELVVLVTPMDGFEASSDPLAAAVGISTSTTLPDDPALARLLPDAYRDDTERSAEFRRYTETDLRERKAANARVAVQTLDDIADSNGKLRLDAAQAAAWLGALNDLRLTLGTRLEVSEDADADLAQLADDDSRQALYSLYMWLGLLQETLVRALS